MMQSKNHKVPLNIISVVGFVIRYTKPYEYFFLLVFVFYHPRLSKLLISHTKIKLRSVN